MHSHAAGILLKSKSDVRFNWSSLPDLQQQLVQANQALWEMSAVCSGLMLHKTTIDNMLHEYIIAPSAFSLANCH